MEIKINQKQATEFAFSLKGYIAEYVDEHRAEYEAYLLESGQVNEEVFNG